MIFCLVLITLVFTATVNAQAAYRPKTESGAYCMIPFEKNGKTYHDCTSDGASKPFCRTPDNNDANCANGPDFSSCQVGNPVVSISEVQSILELVNNLRSKEPALRMAKLRWNSELAKRAQYLSNQCSLSGVINNLCSSASPMGQISYMTSSTTPQPKKWNEFINSFYNSKSAYNIDDNTCKGDCIGYKQLVNAQTTDIGCGVASCNKGGSYTDYYHCNFYPPNFMGKPFEKGDKKCDDCFKLSISDKFRCSNDLCEMCDAPGDDCKGYVAGSGCIDLDPDFCKLNSAICPNIELLPNDQKEMVKSKCRNTCKLCY